MGNIHLKMTDIERVLCLLLLFFFQINMLRPRSIMEIIIKMVLV